MTCFVKYTCCFPVRAPLSKSTALLSFLVASRQVSAQVKMLESIKVPTTSCRVIYA